MDVTLTGVAQSALGSGYQDGRYQHDKMESELKSAIFAAQVALDSTLAKNASIAAKDAADTVYRLHDNIRNVTDTILTATALTNAKIAESQFAFSKEFAIAALQGEKNKSEILAAMSATELRKVQDQLDAEREENEHYKSSVSFGDKFSAIQSQLNSLDQIQRSTNQAINFGSGLIGPQTSTSNQVR